MTVTRRSSSIPPSKSRLKTLRPVCRVEIEADEAVSLGTFSVKALNRRATAFENLGRDEEALRGQSAMTLVRALPAQY